MNAERIKLGSPRPRPTPRAIRLDKLKPPFGLLVLLALVPLVVLLGVLLVLPVLPVIVAALVVPLVVPPPELLCGRSFPGGPFVAQGSSPCAVELYMFIRQFPPQTCCELPAQAALQSPEAALTARVGTAVPQ